MQDGADSVNDPEGYKNALDRLSAERLTSARTVLAPLIQTFAPTSVLDMGCGHGAWLQAARELGVDTVQGVDGPWIDSDALMIPKQNFKTHALEQPLDLERTFNLVISLEVAEHLPENAADIFVESLVRHGDVVLFSAAIPFQGGRGHVNEQWPGYWAAKFAALGYCTIDAIRPMIWHDNGVLWWLRQNILLFLSDAALSCNPDFVEDVVDDFDNLAIVHPELYLRLARMANR